MRVLALDTTTARGSLALLEGGELVAEVRVTSAALHSRWVFPALGAVLQANGLAPRDLDGLAVTLGPGSFTGIRVGIAAIQGLATGLGKPCLGLSALDVLASLSPRRPVVALLDAWRNEVYAGVYTDHEAAAPFAAPLEGLGARMPPRAVVLGDGAVRYRERLLELWPELEIALPDLFLAAALGRLAAPMLAAGRGRGPEALAPLYVRGAGIRPPSR
jgi:tRNA threonylcarbamoyladenosine biosynthesis protein TsaB